MALIFSTWGSELTPEANKTVNAACQNLAESISNVGNAVSVLKEENCFERTSLDMAEQLRSYADCIRVIESECIENTYKEGNAANGNLASSELNGIIKDLASILERFDHVSKYLELSEGEFAEFLNSLDGTTALIQKYMGEAVYTAAVQDSCFLNRNGVK